MNSTGHIDSEDLTLFALQFLSKDEAAAIRSHLEHCEECRNELAAIEGDLAIYAMTVETHAPPAQARERLLAELVREPRLSSGGVTQSAEIASGSLLATTGPRDPSRTDLPGDRTQRSVVPISIGQETQQRRGIAVMPWIGWAAAAMFALTAGLLYHDRQSLRGEVASVRHQATESEAGAKQAQLSAGELQSREAQTQTENATLASRSAKLEAVNSELASERTRFQAAEQAAQAESAKVRADSDRMQAQNAALSARNEQIQAANTSLEAERATMLAQNAKAREVLATLSDAHAIRVTLTRPKQAPAPEGKATYDPDRGALVFLASNLDPLQAAKTYELWLIPANGQAPIAAGTFRPDRNGNANVILPTLPKGVAAKAFGITVENEGGATSPTMPILLAGAAGD